MAELIPIPLPLLLRRAFLEYHQENKIFDLPANKFFRGLPGLDTSVISNGHRASTPLGPAAGPHDQLAQNIVLCWLGGARIIELKTVQILDELKIPRPCIDAANVGYNVEWSQELKLEQSLREYVGAAMLIEILKASRLLGEEMSANWGDTVFDMSVGYNLEGIRSPRVRSWIQSMKNAGAIIDELRAGLGGEFAPYRGLPFPTCISDTITLSTFHGCPAGEIEGIVRFLLTEMDVHVCIKLNPTMLGREEVEGLLHERLGYREIQCHPEAFEHDLQFSEAVDLIPRLDAVAKSHGKHLSVKFSNTLVVRNHKSYFTDELMYLSGPPLHVIAMNLVKKFRAAMGANSLPISFSGGIDAHNFANAVAMNLVPVTTCTDLLRPGGYSRLIRYMENLGDSMRAAGATTIAEFVGAALDTASMVDQATRNPRYTWERNKGVPRKIGSKLWFYDCISCDKCIPVCPNDANFSYESAPSIRQYANYADACNECGNCDVMCPEDGGPFIAKPRFFGSLESYRKYGHPNGFYIEYDGDRKTIHGTIDGQSYTLTDGVPVNAAAVDGAAPYRQLKQLLDAVADPSHIHFANIAGLSIQENSIGKQLKR